MSRPVSNLLQAPTQPHIAIPKARYDAGPFAVLTVVFHADPNLLGARLWIAQTSEASVLGRGSEFTSTMGQPCQPLMQATISRELAYLQVQDGVLELTHRTGSSALTLNTRESRGGSVTALELSADVHHSIVISHAIVLCLSGNVATEPDDQIYPDLIGVSEPIRSLQRRVQQVAQTPDDVLITGPTGAGKEVVARAIHRLGSRQTRPFVAVNVAAIPDSLAPALLFGSEKGVFTGAQRRRNGFFQNAQKGTLFLDEVGDASASLQAQLLRVLQERQAQVVGGELLPLDVRVLAATELPVNSQDAPFRQALLHRLSQQRLEVPPLSAHPDDLGVLARHRLMIEQDEPWVAPADAQGLAAWASLFAHAIHYPWPGNVREFYAVLGQACLTPELPECPPQFLEVPVQESEPVATERSRTEPHSDATFLTVAESLDYSASAVARHIGCSRQSVYRRYQALGIPSINELDGPTVQSALTKHDGDLRLVAKALRVSHRALLRAAASGKFR